MKVFRIIILIVLFLLGIACIVWYFMLKDSPDDTEELQDSGVLLTDTSPLGKLSVLSDRKTLAAGNARG